MDGDSDLGGGRTDEGDLRSPQEVVADTETKALAGSPQNRAFARLTRDWFESRGAPPLD